MPVMKNGHDKPDWVKWSAFGVFSCSRAADFDRHYHDADEYWLIFAGRAIILSEGIQYEVGPGDIVCTRMGEEHDFLHVLEPVRAFYVEKELQGLKRSGHLHYPGWEARKAADLAQFHSDV